MPRLRWGYLLGLLLGWSGATAAELPAGNAPDPIPFDHFPTRLHAVIWRNWGLVPAAKLAEVLGCREQQATALATSMGLPADPGIPPVPVRRFYITLLRRNWHLLPYEQLTALVGMSAEELSFSLREDDFLFEKLGSLKPRCEPVRYTEPDAAARARAEEIARLVRDRFGAGPGKGGEPRFGFLERLTKPSNGPRGTIVRNPAEGPRYVYSYCAVYGDSLADGATESYPDGLLAALADNGVNGIWIHVVLRQLAPGGAAFPEFGDGWERRLANLRGLVARAKRFGLDVYLYMNEPRAMPESFFANRPEMAGPAERGFRALCTSDGRVLGWMTAALAHVFREVPGLGGVFTITGSENLTSCGSHFQQKQCPRCKDRRFAEIAGEVNAAIERGVHAGNPDAKVIAWDWGWPDSDAIDRLPAGVMHMSVSEWSQPYERGGIKGQVGEYSLSVPGPGPRALAYWARARSRGLKTMAKLQLNNTWELSSVPSLPVLDLVAEDLAGLSRAKVDGAMMSWTLGGYPSLNLKAAQRFASDPSANPDGVLDALAAERYGPEHVARARAAWRAFSRAFLEFPYDGAVLYQGPQQYGPANLLFARPTGYRSTMVGFPYDHLDGWRGAYPREILADQFGKVAEGWKEGLASLEAIPGDHAAEDLRIARAAGLHFASSANQARFVIARDAGRRDRMAAIARDEARLARELYDLTLADSRIGFEASNQYYYTPLDLVEKVVACEAVARSADDELRPIPLKSKVTHVQPMTGIVLWSTNEAARTSPIQLEFRYFGYDEVVREKGEYDWSAVERFLDGVAGRGHQAVLRWRDTYVGKPSGVPPYIQALADYRGRTAKSEGKPTGFPDWSHPELRRFTLEFFDRFAAKYDRDPRLAFLEVGFGLWAEYHLYDGPMVMGRTFPSLEYQREFANHLGKRFVQTPWMISVDAAGEWAPYAKDKALLALPFGVFDDSFNHARHAKVNEPNWNALNRDRWKVAPTGGEFSFYERKDQNEALAPNGPHGESFEHEAARFHLTFMIGDAQPRHQKPDRIREASMACGYHFRVTRFEASSARSEVTITNSGVAPIYHDAFPAVNGVRAPESLKGLPPGESRTFHVPAGGSAPSLSIESDRLVRGQRIEFDAELPST
ncbi:hypothetical protein [Aquisphaera insulae]|uniref:hypothetical protein n=1 Tax=Aquisphaera insulae TaxID=2712864 RepID=UPI00202FE7E7|nr:hypothetical protein [Aquisphaera insulae]